MGVLAGLLGAAGLVKFGCLPVVASRLLKILRCCVVVFCFRLGNRKIRSLGLSEISSGQFRSSGHEISLLRFDRYGKLSSPGISLGLMT
jgi:hypothetical protein